MLTPREENILKIVVSEYVSTAAPVGSESIARRHQLGVSPATIRNEMAHLEEEGYITHPYTSAGRIPSDKGYRYYVESLMDEVELSQAEQRMIRHQFHQVERELEEWTRLAAAILSRMIQNVAIVTLPKAVKSRLRHLELVFLQEFLVLLILVLEEAKLKQQMLTFDELVSPEELTAIAKKLNTAYMGLTGSEINAQRLHLSPIEEQVTRVLVQLMQAEQEREYEEPCIDGLRHIFGQPEFAARARVHEIMTVFEETSVVSSILSQALSGVGLRVVIGGENWQDFLRDCSLVLTQYGIPAEFSGVISAMGPTRMEYGRTICTIRFLATVMNELVGELYGRGGWMSASQGAMDSGKR